MTRVHEPCAPITTECHTPPRGRCGEFCQNMPIKQRTQFLPLPCGGGREGVCTITSAAKIPPRPVGLNPPAPVESLPRTMPDRFPCEPAPMHCPAASATTLHL